MKTMRVLAGGMMGLLMAATSAHAIRAMSCLKGETEISVVDSEKPERGAAEGCLVKWLSGVTKARVAMVDAVDDQAARTAVETNSDSMTITGIDGSPDAPSKVFAVLGVEMQSNKATQFALTVGGMEPPAAALMSASGHSEHAEDDALVLDEGAGWKELGKIVHFKDNAAVTVMTMARPGVNIADTFGMWDAKSSTFLANQSMGGSTTRHYHLLEIGCR